jgi:hypothetical protein
MITSASYLRRILKIYNHDYFQIDYAKVIAKWCIEYYGIYKSSPGTHIEDIFNSRKREFQDGQERLAGEFLQQISRAHEERENFNSEYLYEKTRKYFYKRALLIMTERVEAFAQADRVSDAQGIIKSFKSIASDVSPWINPLDDQFISEVFSNMDHNRLFQLPGKLGELIGAFERGWLVGWLGPMKRGKTFWLFECAIRAAMQKLNVVIVSLEMNAPTNAMRIYHRMTALPDKPGEYLSPVFDCGNNQDGSCSMKERRKFNDVCLFVNEEKPEFSKSMDYRICSYCRDNPTLFRKGENPYLAAHWYISSEYKEPFSIEAVRQSKSQFVTQYGSRIRFRPYPAFSASLDDLEKDLETLEFTEGFIPDVIVIDYADILMPPDKRLIERSALDSIWKGLKGMAEKRNCLVITASQSNRGAIKKESMDQTDIAEDIRKIAHVDAMFGLNQQRSERSDMVIRINTLAHRHRASADYRQAIVLNQLDLGLPCIDSEIITKNFDD